MQEDPKGIKVLLASAIVCQCSYDVLSYRVSGGSPASTLHSDLVQSKTVGQIWIEPADEAFFEQCSSETLKSKSQDVMIGSNNSYAYVLVAAAYLRRRPRGRHSTGHNGKPILRMRTRKILIF